MFIQLINYKTQLNNYKSCTKLAVRNRQGAHHRRQQICNTEGGKQRPSKEGRRGKTPHQGK